MNLSRLNWYDPNSFQYHTEAVESLLEARRPFIRFESARYEAFHLGLPARWFYRNKMRCFNGHIFQFKDTVRLDPSPRDLCPTCCAPALLTYPEDEAE